MKNIFVFLLLVSSLWAQEETVIDGRAAEELEFTKQYETFVSGSDEDKAAICEKILSSQEELLKTNPCVLFKAGSFLVKQGRDKTGVDLLAIGYIRLCLDVHVAVEISPTCSVVPRVLFDQMQEELETSEDFFVYVRRRMNAVIAKKIDWILDSNFSYNSRWPVSETQNVENDWSNEKKIQEVREQIRSSVKNMVDNEIFYAESVLSPKKEDTDLKGFEKIIDHKEESSRYTVLIPSAEPEGGWKECIIITFEKYEIRIEPDNVLQPIIELRTKLKKKRPAIDICHKYLGDWAHDLGEASITSRIYDENDAERSSLMFDFDLTADTEKSEKFWSTSKIIKTEEGIHCISYHRLGELRVSRESKKWKNIIDSFEPIANG